MHFTPHLYLDPGSGSILIQVLVATVIGIGVALRGSWGKIRAWFGYKPATEDDDSSDEK